MSCPFCIAGEKPTRALGYFFHFNRVTQQAEICKDDPCHDHEPSPEERHERFQLRIITNLKDGGTRLELDGLDDATFHIGAYNKTEPTALSILIHFFNTQRRLKKQ